MRRFLIGFVLFLVSLPFSVSAVDYYVDKDSIGGTACSDSGPGTLSQPFCTIGQANSVVQPGDTVYIREGTYSETIIPSNSGTPDNYITYSAYSGETPIITLHQVLTGWQHHSGNIYRTNYAENWYSGVWEDTFEESGYYVALEPVFSLSDLNGPGKYYGDADNKIVYVWTRNGDDPNNHVMRMGSGKGVTPGSYIVVDGITIRWVQRGIKCENCFYNIFKNMVIEYSFGFGIQLSGGSRYNQVLNNKIYNVGSWYWDEGDGIHLGADAHHNLIQGNDISIVAHNPITSYGGSGSAPHHNIIQNNVVHDSGSSGLNTNVKPYSEVWRNNTAYGNTGAGLQTDSSDNIFYWNKFYHNGWLEDAGSEGISVYAVSSSPSDNNRFFHNVIYDSKGRGVTVNDWGETCNNNIFKNNIIFDSDASYEIRFDTAGEVDNNVFTYNNIYKTSGTYVYVHWVGQETLSWYETNYPLNFNNNVQDDPLFADQTANDFHLQAGSPCVDNGSWLTYTTSPGSGTQIPVEDASYFIDGYGIVDGDLIQLEGQTQTAGVTAVDYSNNIVTVDTPLSWSSGQGVSLSYFGSAPDIGAYEYESPGKAYYVDASGGDDSNDGLSPQNAWQTIGKVNSFNFETGDDIYFKRGETFVHTVYISLKHGGTASDPAIVGTYGDGPRPIISTPYGGLSCYKANLGYITIQDLDIRDADGGQSLSFGADNISHVTIRRVNIDGNTDRNGILLTRIDNYLIEDCTIANTGNSGIAIIGSPTYPITNGIIRNNTIVNGGSNDCITLHKNGEGDDIGPNHLLVNNVGSGCDEQAFDLTSGDNITLLNCEGFGNGVGSISIGHEPSNIWIDGFYSHDESSVAIIVGTSTNVKVTNSIIYHTNYAITISHTKNFEAYHNTIVYGPDTSYGVDIGYNDTDGVTFKNNIFTSTANRPGRYVRYLSNATPENTNSDFSHNIWWRPDGGQTGDNRFWYVGYNILYRFDQWQNLFPEEQFTDPMLANPVSGNLHLRSDSPAIDNGTNVGFSYDFDGNTRPRGTGYDIGAYEFLSGFTLLGDLNNDGVVDIFDLIFISPHFGKIYPHPEWNVTADAVPNDEIDIYDIVFVASRFS